MLCPADTLGGWVGKQVKARVGLGEAKDIWTGVLVAADCVGIWMRFDTEEDFIPWTSIHHLCMEDG